jgi:hypothetical protein
MVLGIEGKRDDVSHRGRLKEIETVSATVDILTDWLPDDVGRIKDEACSVVADIDLMGYRSGSRREQSDSAEQCVRGEDHDVFVKRRLVDTRKMEYERINL